MGGARCDKCGGFVASDDLVVIQPEDGETQVLCKRCGEEHEYWH